MSCADIFYVNGSGLHSLNKKAPKSSPELAITVGHWTFSKRSLSLSEQKPKVVGQIVRSVVKRL